MSSNRSVSSTLSLELAVWSSLTFPWRTCRSTKMFYAAFWTHVATVQWTSRFSGILGEVCASSPRRRSRRRPSHPRSSSSEVVWFTLRSCTWWSLRFACSVRPLPLSGRLPGKSRRRLVWSSGFPGFSVWSVF